jgi:hypothetical protein
MATIARSKGSTATTVYQFKITGLSAASINSLILPNIDPQFVPNPDNTRIRAIGGTSNGQVASFNADPATFKQGTFNDANGDPKPNGTVLIDIYPDANTTGVILDLA